MGRPLVARLALAAVTALCLAVSLTSLPVAASSRVQFIGGWAGSHPSDWLNANQTTQIGPLQTEKDWFPNTSPPRMLPLSFTDTACYKIYVATPRHNPICLIAYKDTVNGQIDNSNLQSFISSIPPSHATVIMLFYMEPDVTLWQYNCHITKTPQPSYASGAQYVQQFEAQSTLIRQYASQAGLTNVQVASGSGIASFNPNKSVGCNGKDYYGYNCAFIPPPAYTDHYFTEVYHPKLILIQNDKRFAKWNGCTSGLGKSQGISDYALGVCKPGGGTFTESDRAAVMAQDAAYLAANFPNLYMWQYWWFHTAGNPNPCESYRFPAASSATPQTAQEWQAIEAGTVPS
jgi:hypothetical protein